MKLPTLFSIDFDHLFKKYVKEVSRETIIFWGVIGMAFLQATLMGWAAYIFSATVLGERTHTVGPVRDILLEGGDIKKVVGLLDLREKKFREVLGIE